MWKKYMTIKEAAEFLALSTQTIRNWDKSGKLRALRHPSNGYRLYTILSLEKALQKTKKQKTNKSRFTLSDAS